MKEIHLPHRQVLLREERTFHYKVAVPLNFVLTVILTFQQTLILFYQLEEDTTVGQYRKIMFNAFHV